MLETSSLCSPDCLLKQQIVFFYSERLRQITNLEMSHGAALLGVYSVKPQVKDNDEFECFLMAKQPFIWKVYLPYPSLGQFSVFRVICMVLH